MLVVLILGLISLRYLLTQLGVHDYGVYNVIFGLLSILMFFSNAIVDSCQRYFSFAIQNKDWIKLNTEFSSIFILTIFLGLGFATAAFTLGFNFAINNLDLSEIDLKRFRLFFNLLTISFFLQLITLPLSSLIISFERMKLYGLLSVLEVFLKFIATILLFYIEADSLILYSGLLLIIYSIVFIIYLKIILNKHINLVFSIRKKSIQDLFSFFSWNSVGSIASVAKNYGTNTVLNVFWGPILNTARGIAFQLNGVLVMFAQNFTQAVKLEIYKNFADNKIDILKTVVVKSTKYQYYLMLLVSLPLLFETEFILDIWLNNYPEEAIVFTKLAVILCLIDTLSYSLMAAVLATGRIKKYSYSVGILITLNVPISYYFLASGYAPYCVVYISIIVSIFAFLLRLKFYSELYSLNLLEFLHSTIIPASILTLIVLLVPTLVNYYLELSWMRFIISSFLMTLQAAAFIYLFGLDSRDKTYLRETLKLNYIKVYEKWFISN